MANKTAQILVTSHVETVFTNGVFDIVHRGHLELLRYCKARPSRTHVVVAIDSDRSVKSLKGDSRPINNEEDRKFFLESLRDVDEVVVFDSQEDLYDLIKKIKPDLIVKGGDYAKEEVLGGDIADVYIFNCLKKDGVKVSSSSLIEKIQKNIDPDKKLK